MKEQFGLEFEDDRVDKKDKRKMRHDKWMSSKSIVIYYFPVQLLDFKGKIYERSWLREPPCEGAQDKYLNFSSLPLNEH